MKLSALPATLAGFGRAARDVLARRGRAPDDDAAREAALWRLFADLRPSFADAPGVRPDAALGWIAAPDVIVLDVRGEAERAVSRLPGAVDALPEAPDGRRVLVYCTIGFRSGHETLRLRARGWDATNLEGGVLAWTHVGGPLVRDGDPVDEVHVYGASWDLARRDVRGVW